MKRHFLNFLKKYIGAILESGKGDIVVQSWYYSLLKLIKNYHCHLLYFPYFLCFVLSFGSGLSCNPCNLTFEAFLYMGVSKFCFLPFVVIRFCILKHRTNNPTPSLGGAIGLS